MVHLPFCCKPTAFKSRHISRGNQTFARNGLALACSNHGQERYDARRLEMIFPYHENECCCHRNNGGK